MKKSICYFYVVFGAACWGFIGLFNRMLGDVGVSVGTRVTVRNLFALALLTVIFGLFHRQVFHIQARHLPIFLGAGILSVLGMAVAYFQCQMLCSLAVAGVLLYLAPSFVVLMSAALWRAPITKRKLAALALALLGCAFVSGIAWRRTDRLTRRDSARRRRGLLLRDVYHLRALRSAALRQLYHDVLDVHVRGDRVTVFPQARGAAACVRKSRGVPGCWGLSSYRRCCPISSIPRGSRAWRAARPPSLPC